MTTNTSSTALVNPLLGNLASAQKIGNPKATADNTKAREAAEDFEAVFLTEMFRPLFESVEVDPVFGGGKGEEVFRGFMVQEYGKQIAKQGGVGLSHQVMQELLRTQEQSTTGVK